MLPKCFHNGPNKTLPSLRVLGMAGSSPDGTAMDELEGWSKIIPFRNLQVLQLDGFQNERLLVNAPLYRFSSLKTLTLDLSIDRRNIEDRQGTACRMDSAASGFLYSLPPLESLYLSSTYILRTIIQSNRTTPWPTIKKVRPHTSTQPRHLAMEDYTRNT